MPILSNFPGGSGGGGGLALNAVSNIKTLVASNRVYVQWTDPSDIVIDDLHLATWAGTLLVRKAGSMPSSRRDGTVVLDITMRNQYFDNYFCDSGLSNGTTYYYKFFPYTTTGTYTESADNEFIATPTAQVNGIDNWNVTNMSASSEAGDGKMTIKWTDPPAVISDDGITLATWGATTVVVKADDYATDKNDVDAAFTQKVTSRNQYANASLTATGLTNGTTYYISFFPETTDGGVNTSTIQRCTGIANRITIPAIPSQSGSLTYNGNAQTPLWNNYDAEKMTLRVTAQTNAGTYSASFTPDIDYRWNDGETTVKNINWTIDKAAGSLTLSKTNIMLDSDTKSTTFTVIRTGDGAITVESNDPSVAAVSLIGTTVTVSSVNDKKGTAIITVKVAAGTNHNAPEDATCSVTAEFKPIKRALNDTSWSEIKEVSDAGDGANYWAIGDRKAVILNGTVGTKSISGTYYVYIIGFNHNSVKEGTGIQFGTFKNDLSDGADVCLVDGEYGGIDGDKYFNMNHWGDNIDASTTNYGGWAACDMRYDILGSTNVAPSPYGITKTSSVTGSNPTNTCTSNPVANTLMAALPADLRAVMKPITKYTNNKGSISTTPGDVTATIDYLPLLSEFEVTGLRTNANQYEQNYQTQYTYFASGNSRTKSPHNNVDSGYVGWWLRSPECGSNPKNHAVFFCCVYTNGSSVQGMAGESYGIAPVFMV